MFRGLNPFETPPRVFISYARSDGEEIARSLPGRLDQEHPEITLWLDRARMVAGLGWWKQITEALDRVVPDEVESLLPAYKMRLKTDRSLATRYAREGCRTRPRGINLIPEVLCLA